MADEEDTELEPVDTDAAEPVTGDTGDSGDTGDGDKPLSLRDQIVKSVKTLRGDEEDKDDKEPRKPPKTAKGAADATKPTKPIPAKAGDAQTSPGAQAAPAATTAPKWLPEEAKKAWESVPDAVKTAVAKFEQSSANGVQQLKNRVDAYDREVSKLDHVFQKGGRDRTTGLQNLVAWALAVENNPAQAISHLAQAYGLRPNPPQQTNGAAGQPQQPRPPQFDLRAAVQPLLAPVMQELNQLKQARVNESQSASDAAVNSWAKDKPHYQTVRGTMSDLIAVAVKNGTADQYLAADGSPDLDKLYETAVYMNPETRQAVLSERAKGQQTQQRQQALKAKRAGASLRPGTPSARTPGKLTLRETIREAMESVANR